MSLEYQTATGEVLKAISRSVFTCSPCLTPLLQRRRDFAGRKGLLYQLLTGDDRLERHHGPIPEYKTFTEAHPIAPDAVDNGASGCNGAKLVHVRGSNGNDERYSWPASLRLGDRTVLALPLLRDDVPIGVIALVERR